MLSPFFPHHLLIVSSLLLRCFLAAEGPICVCIASSEVSKECLKTSDQVCTDLAGTRSLSRNLFNDHDDDDSDLRLYTMAYLPQMRMM